MMKRRNTRHRAFDPEPDAPDRCCDMHGCDQPAGYRAPRSRDALNKYFWFCLQHVREYNANWDFYRGMTPGQIEAHIRADASWNRPSWKLGQGNAAHAFSEEEVLDPLDLLKGAAKARARSRARQRREEDSRAEAPQALKYPLGVLDLGWPVSMDELKSRYKDLARRHHPDTNGGDRKAEERFKGINIAYATVRAHLVATAGRDGMARSA
ncbi:J domain-containing protein [Komagataeibacter oboediens]|uniref:Molecular chaperone DnaJ n=2 Tax=Komagataeibacter TaxID=1434011 RepID=A0A318QT81_9PROT|nr:MULTISPECIES: J domain-containing protein [Komagataeibacter]MBV0887251.1 J domain-containing protein [Komagataeibacter oboediens]MBV1822821.1 J domain-containing protein [Komagataeibacter oboediens]MCK9818920.1 J domain-containing protein [Komagataeibacter oboediens]PYD82766.1 molecular chaperone DnaJ [Komagataeibacter oboediens]WEQ52007.1 J domain-containing protein [Komagataeibacter oboediens]